VQQHFPLARVVKSLNHLGYFKFDQGRRAPGAPDRLAMAAAGNDPHAVVAVMRLIDRLGFDAVNAGSLSAGVALQPGGPLFGIGLSADKLRKLLSLEASQA
jgi:predicted dinucleotide-binding enzyme